MSFDENSYSTDGWSHNLIADYGNVVALGIYGLPGTKFKVNQLNANTPETLVLNGSGLFSIDIEHRPITELRVHKDSIDLLNSNGGHYLVLDLIYERGNVI
jgi:hypothetical protein